MVTALVDTSVLVDILRLNQTARHWIAGQQDRLGVTPIVWLEVIQGSDSKLKQNDALALLKRFERIELTSGDYDWAIQQAIRLKLSHNVGGMDCLIASASHRLQIPLYTTNLKHFASLLGALAQKPY
jgi:predicted nucleic acid-binding protein